VDAGGACRGLFAWRPSQDRCRFSPSSSADQLTRLANDFSTAFGQRFYGEYRTGNSGSIAASLTARATPDGYTLMIGGSRPHTAASLSVTSARTQMDLLLRIPPRTCWSSQTAAARIS
jgi:tripartite-type tricarboxylate transporter receptor subunit TctC